MTIQVKICGIKMPDMLDISVRAGARFIGFVFYPQSPRHIDIDTAKELAMMLPTGVRSVGLFVNPSDEQLDEVLGRVSLDMIQLHGDESPQRVAQIKARYHLPVIKAIPIRVESDFDNVEAYEAVCDWLLFDAKPENSKLPGGTGQSFDWALLEGKSFTKPWMLSGGLNADNVVQALSALTPMAVDVSSSVERERGVKDAAKIAGFIAAVK